MLITNNTNQDYWLGPIRLPAGATGFSFDDTTETSLYLLHDEVADAVNTLSSSGMITCSSTATPFPRPTGVPSVLHGDGSPLGLVYAPQGSLYMRRDTTGASTSLYVKTSGIDSNIGWYAIVVGGTDPIYTSLPPGPGAGQVATLRLGSSPYEFIRMIYDATYGHWVSEEHIAQFGMTSWNGAFLRYREAVGAGLTLQCRLIFDNASPDGGGTLQMGYFTANAGDVYSAYTFTGFGSTINITQVGDPVFYDTGWQSLTGATTRDYAVINAITADTSGANNYTLYWRWID